MLEIMEEGRVIWNDDVMVRAESSAVEYDDRRSDGGMEGGDGDDEGRWLEVGTIIGEVDDDDNDNKNDREGGKERKGKKEEDEWSWQAYTHNDDES